MANAIGIPMHKQESTKVPIILDTQLKECMGRQILGKIVSTKGFFDTRFEFVL